MKKWLCLVLVGLMLLCCTACDGEPARSGESTAPTPITDTQKEDIQTFLNDLANNGFVGHTYTSPEKISPQAVFYDGAGVGISGTTDWSEQEKQAVLAAAGWDAYHNPPLKLPRSEVERVLQENLGLSPEKLETDLTESFCYVEAYDAYYTMHGDTNYAAVSITAGWVTPDDVYVIEYTSDCFSGSGAVVTLRKTDTGFQFVSNVRK